MENDNSFIWIFSLGAKFVLGTMAGTTEVCTQYPARVTNTCNAANKVARLMRLERDESGVAMFGEDNWA